MSQSDKTMQVMRRGGRFGWAWIGRALLLRKWQLLCIFATTLLIYGAGLALPILLQRVVDGIVSGAGHQILIWLGVAAFVAVMMEALLVAWRDKFVISLGNFVDRQLSRKLFVHLMRVRTDIGHAGVGERLIHFQQSAKIKNFILQTIPRSIFNTGSALLSAALIIYYDWIIGIAVILASAIFAVIQKNRIQLLYKFSENYYDAAADRQDVLSESIGGIRTIKSIALEGPRFRKWMTTTDALIEAVRQASENGRKFFFRSQIATESLTFLVLTLGCLRVLDGQLSIGGLLALQMLVGRVTGPILNSSDVIRECQDVNVAVNQLRQFMSIPHERALSHPAVRSLGHGGIAVRDLGLQYDGAAGPALQDVSFDLPERGVIAIVGRNGSGKSTLIKILLGLQRDYSGSVLLFGHDLRHYRPRWLRSRIGVVDQDTVLFSGTIRESVSGGTETDHQAVRRALAFSDALGFVDALPLGLDSPLQENGKNLSGGQRQRLSIARAVIRDPKLALFDEPTAFLDPEAAVSIERRLAAWGRDRLLLLVSHHLLATRDADRILVLEGGRLVGDGRHEQLLMSCREYRALWLDYIRAGDDGLDASAPLPRGSSLHAAHE